MRQLLAEFRQTLQHHLWLEEWATWLENIVSKTLEPYEGKPAYPKAARQFLLKWSFYRYIFLIFCKVCLAEFAVTFLINLPPISNIFF